MKILQRHRRAKIVATIGPSSSSKEVLKSLIQQGLDVARINMSHGEHALHRAVIQSIREISKELGREVGILLDLQGPKIRVSKLPTPLILEKNDHWAISSDQKEELFKDFKKSYKGPIALKGLIPSSYNLLDNDLSLHMPVLFDDGLIQGSIIAKEGPFFILKIEVAGTLKSNKGINLPMAEVSLPSFTEKDQEDLFFGLKEGVDFVALSFVRKASDVIHVKALIHELKLDVPVIAKIERPQAVERIDEIIDVASAIMIARGDMGVEIGNHLVPNIQKEIILKCNDKGVPVITATQMLESMIQNPAPTRAEASDVANAIWDGTDAVMLSGETASGLYPKEAIAMMNKIIIEAEKRPKDRPLLRHVNLASIRSAIVVAASLVAEKIFAQQIVCITQSGNTPLKLSRFRPVTPVIAASFDEKVARRSSLYWGTHAYTIPKGLIDENDHFQEMDLLKKIKIDFELKSGDKLIVVRGDGKFFSGEDLYSVRVEILKDETKSENLDIVELPKGKILFDPEVCGSCQNCLTICPHQIWETSQEGPLRTVLNKEKAMLCAFDQSCMDNCPTGAIEILEK